MEATTTYASHSSPLHPTLSARLKPGSKSELYRAAPGGSEPTGISSYAPSMNIQDPVSTAATMYTPWATRRQSAQIHADQAPTPSFTPHGDLDINYYTGNTNAWGFQPISSNTMAHAVPSSFSSVGSLPGGTMELTTQTMSHNAMPLGTAKNFTDLVTPELSPQSVSLSPSSDYPWTSPADPGDESLPKSPRKAGRPTSPILRSDGLRKKNAKFEIPEERTLDTIDKMISKANCEDMVKELKAQKRLLKNREAALQSRQRKKQHTEDLEGLTKRYSNHIQNQSNIIAEVTAEMGQVKREKLQLQWQAAEADKQLQQLHIENITLKQELFNLHGAVHPAHSTPASSIPSTANFDGFPADLDPINFDMTEWMGLIGNPCFPPNAGTHMAGKVGVSTAINMPQHHRPSDAPGHACKATASRLLLVLVMAGAMISNSQTPQRALSSFMSKLPNDIKSVSVKVLDSVMRSGSFNILTHVPLLELQPGEFDHATIDLISNMQDNITPEVVDELIELVEYATARARSQSTTSLERSPVLGSMNNDGIRNVRC